MNADLYEGSFLALGAALVWGINGIILKKGAKGEEPGRALFWRGISASPLLFVLAYVLLGASTVTRIFQSDIVGLVFLSSFTVSVGDYAIIMAMKKVPVSVAVPISSSYPIFGAIFVIFSGLENLTIAVLLGTIAVIVGLGLIGQQTAGNNGNNTQATDLWGIIYSLVAALMWGISIAILRIIFSYGNVDGMALMALRTLFIAIIGISFYYGRVRTGKWEYQIDVDEQHKARNLFLISGIIGWAIGATAFMYAIQQAGALIATPLSAISPFFAALFGVRFLNEQVGKVQSFGILFIVLGSVIIVL